MTRFVNLPKLRERRDYDLATQEFIETIKNFPDVLSVYTAGSVSHPGISDLDFVLCLRDELTEPLDIETRLSPLARELIGGGSVLKVNETNFSMLALIDDFSLFHVWGREYVFKEYASGYFEICRVFDWLPERIFSLQQLSVSREIDVLWALQLLKSLANSIERAQCLMGLPKSLLGMKLYDLREHWFADVEESKEILMSLVSFGLSEGRCVLDLFCVWIEQHSIVKGMASSFDIDWVVPSGPRFTTAGSLSRGSEAVVVSPVLMTFLRAQAEAGSGKIAACVGNSFSSDFDFSSSFIDPDLLDVIAARIEYVDSLADYFIQFGLSSGLLKYGWYLPNYEQAKS